MKRRLKQSEKMALIYAFFDDSVMQGVLDKVLGVDGGTVLVLWEKNIAICKSPHGEMHYNLRLLLKTLKHAGKMQ